MQSQNLVTLTQIALHYIGYLLDTTLKYAPDNSWYILTMNEVFELGGSLVREPVAHNLMRLLAEGVFFELAVEHPPSV